MSPNPTPISTPGRLAVTPETNDTPENAIEAILSLISFSPHGLLLSSLFLQSTRLFTDIPISIISNIPAIAPAVPFAIVLPNCTPAI